MPQKPKGPPQPKHIHTGGGAYIAGSVRVEGGDFVGRDKRVEIHPTAQGVTVQDFLCLLAQVREMLPAAGLDPEMAEAAAEDLRIAEEQAGREEPRGDIVLAKLKSAAELVGAAGGAATGISQLIPLIQQALQWAQQLFR